MSPAGEPFYLRYASHLGYRSAQSPLFLHSVGSADPLAQIEHAAGIGMSGVQYALAASRPVAEQTAVGARLRALKLAPGCVVYAPFERIRELLPGDPDPQAAVAFFDQMQRALEVAERVGSRLVVILPARAAQMDLEVQRRVFAERLTQAAGWASAAGVVLGLEPLSSPLLPPMLMTHLDEALAIIASGGAENVKLLFDTAHVQINDGDVGAQFSRVYGSVAALQLADVPNRWEPGSGTIDFESVLREACNRGYQGLIELEHGWSREDSECEKHGLERLRKLDASVRRDDPLKTKDNERG